MLGNNNAETVGIIRIGTSGFQFEDWKGSVYPPDITEPAMLSYYEKHLGFDTVEINFTYYRLPSPKAMEGMAKKTSDGFEFSVRSNKEMTHEIWEDNKRLRLKENARVFALFREGLKPLIQTKKLGCVLMQFPYFFWPHKENYGYILRCKEYLNGLPLIIEFRNKNWAQEDTFQFLKDNQLGFCVVDEPKLPQLMPYIPKATGPIGYFRFHGRNLSWFKASREERYNYLYSEDELKSFLPSIHRIVHATEKAYIYFNNCHAGNAVKNALLLKQLFKT